MCVRRVLSEYLSRRCLGEIVSRVEVVCVSHVRLSCVIVMRDLSIPLLVGAAGYWWTNKFRPRWMFNESQRLRNSAINPLSFALVSGASCHMIMRYDHLIAAIMTQGDARRVKFAANASEPDVKNTADEAEVEEEDEDVDAEDGGDAALRAHSPRTREIESDDEEDEQEVRMRKKYTVKQRPRKKNKTALKPQEPFSGPMRMSDSYLDDDDNENEDGDLTQDQDADANESGNKHHRSFAQELSQLLQGF